jgi:FKBP-type peptidyl-prolyl cis-trans isomerase FklB
LLTYPSKYIFYKKLAPVATLEGYVYDPTQIALDQSSSVDVYYRGTNILGEYFDGYTGSEPTEFDAPSTFTVLYGNVITGWWEVLQRMGLGERWEVYIPWEFGYGSSGSGSILGYSTLIFDMQLLRINNLSFDN